MRVISTHTGDYEHKVGDYKLRIDRYEKEPIRNLRNEKYTCSKQNVKQQHLQQKSKNEHIDKVTLEWIWLKRESVTWRILMRN